MCDHSNKYTRWTLSWRSKAFFKHRTCFNIPSNQNDNISCSKKVFFWNLSCYSWVILWRLKVDKLWCLLRINLIKLEGNYPPPPPPCCRSVLHVEFIWYFQLSRFHGWRRSAWGVYQIKEFNAVSNLKKKTHPHRTDTQMSYGTAEKSLG